MASKDPRDEQEILLAGGVPDINPDETPAPALNPAVSMRSINRDVHAGAAAQRPFDALEEAMGNRRGGRTKDEVLKEAGAELDADGNWFRWVPTQGMQRRVVDEDGVFMEADYEPRYVAESPAAARASGGTHDAFIPGLGWLRNGLKAERDAPENLGFVDGAPARQRKVVRTPAPLEEAAAMNASAIRAGLAAQAQAPAAAPAASKKGD